MQNKDDCYLNLGLLSQLFSQFFYYYLTHFFIFLMEIFSSFARHFIPHQPETYFIIYVPLLLLKVPCLLKRDQLLRRGLILFSCKVFNREESI